jgi:hypothetical protein
MYSCEEELFLATLTRWGLTGFDEALELYAWDQNRKARAISPMTAN